jgi:hypothetical protein
MSQSISIVERRPAAVAPTILRSFFFALLLVLALQPAYLLALLALDYVAPAERRAAHITAAFADRSLDRDQNPVKPYDTGGNWDIECIGLALGLQPGASALQNAVAGAWPTGGHNVCAGLADAAAGKPSNWVPYTRYWHGYRVVIDPLSAWLSINRARLVTLALLIAALAFLAAESRQLIGASAALALVAPTIVITDLWRIWFIMTNAVSTMVILAGAAWFARLIRNPASTETALIAAAAGLGSVFNYVDFLINPPWQPALLAFFVLAAPRRAMHPILMCLLVLAAWSCGYALTWAIKWVISAALSPNGMAVFADVADVVRYRLDGDYEQMVDHRFLAPSAKAISFTFTQIWQVQWVTALTLLTPFLMPALRDWRRFSLLAVPAVIPFLWFELLSNHTQIHLTLTYRSVATSVGILLAAWIIASSDPQAA